MFLDPFYSPGSDFIAISNTYICDLIGKDRAGQPFAPYAEIYQQLYFSFYENTLTLYQDQYPLFGDAQVMPLKVIWDYTYYWALLAPLFFGKRLRPICAARPTARRVHARPRAEPGDAGAAARMGRAQHRRRWRPDARFLDQYEHRLVPRDEPRARPIRSTMTRSIARMRANVARMALAGRRRCSTHARAHACRTSTTTGSMRCWRASPRRCARRCRGRRRVVCRARPTTCRHRREPAEALAP